MSDIFVIASLFLRKRKSHKSKNSPTPSNGPYIDDAIIVEFLSMKWMHTEFNHTSITAAQQQNETINFKCLCKSFALNQNSFYLMIKLSKYKSKFDLNLSYQFYVDFLWIVRFVREKEKEYIMMAPKYIEFGVHIQTNLTHTQNELITCCSKVEFIILNLNLFGKVYFATKFCWSVSVSINFPSEFKN